MSTPTDADTPSSGAEQVVDNPAQSRFELDLGEAVAVAYYKVAGDRIALLHTEVPQELSDRGIGSRLAEGVFEALREHGLGVVAHVRSWRPTRPATPNTPACWWASAR